jgi:small-conductance mechanosensitive channel
VPVALVDAANATSTALRRLGISFENALLAALTILVSVGFAWLVRRLMRRSLEPRLPSYVYKPLENIVFYSIVVIGVFAAVAPFGVSLSSLLVAGGFAGLVVGLASQQAVSNLVSGMFLLVEQPLRIGDPVSVGDVSGVVSDINIFSTKIRTWDGYIVRMPNSSVYTSSITNYARTRARRVEIKIGISYKSSIEDAISAIRRLIDEHPFCLVNPAPEVFVEDYADSAIVLNARCWAPSPVWFATKTQLTTSLKKTLEEAGVEIPFPQLDLHVRDSAEIPVWLRGGEEHLSHGQPEKQGEEGAPPSSTR